MKRIPVRSKEYKDFLEIKQLYSALNEHNDIYVNGSINVLKGMPKDIKKVRPVANVCDEEGNILYVLDSFDNLNVKDNTYYSFSIDYVDISRYLDLEELSYVELYVVFDSKY